MGSCLRRVAAFVVAIVVLLVTHDALAQSDQAVRACLLLRSPAECGIQANAVAAAPGDALNTEALRPSIERLKKFPDRPPPVIIVGEHTLVEKHREVYAIPFAYKPFKWLDIAGEVPTIRQQLPESTLFEIGDVSGNATVRYKNEDETLDFRGYAAVKLPTGSTADGTGSGKVDVLGLADVYWKPKRFALEAHGFFRHNGDAQRGELGQGSVSAEYILPVVWWMDVALHARALGDVETAAPDGSHDVRGDLNAVVGLYPRFLNFGVGEILVRAPLVASGGASQAWSVTAGFTKPF